MNRFRILQRKRSLPIAAQRRKASTPSAVARAQSGAVNSPQ